MQRLLCLLVLLLLGASAAAQSLQSDVDLLERAYKTLHPGLYRYTTPAKLDAALKELRLDLQPDPGPAGRYLAFARFAATLRCGHSYANFLNQPKAMQESLFLGPRLPFYFRWIDGQMVVTRVFGDSALKPGAQIQAIDGVPVTQILARLLPYARADGANEAKRLSDLEVQGRSRMEAFDVYYGLLYSLGPKVALRLRTGSVHVASMSVQQREALMPAPAEGPGWELRKVSPTVAYLRMPTWSVYQSKWDWQAWLQERFNGMSLDGTRELIIDLRGNEGGSGAVGDAIIHHLVDRVQARAPLRRLVRYQSVPEELNPYLNTWDPEFRDWGAAARPGPDGFFVLKRPEDEAKAYTPAAPRFRGRSWVLMDAANSSATLLFEQEVKRLGLAKLAGQASGGNLRGITGGAFFFLRLPFSRIELDLPLIAQLPEAEAKDAGLQPDILLAPTVQDIAAGRDTVLEGVLRLIR